MLVQLLSATLEQVFLQRKLEVQLPIGCAHNCYYPFQCKVAPVMPLLDYFQRLSQHTGCSDSVLVLAVTHIARVARQIPTFYVNNLTIHRLLLVSVLCSAKYLDDEYLKNSRYAYVGGIPTTEMNTLELIFLSLIQFSLHISSETYAQIYSELVLGMLQLRT